jgi:hypothetical protein
MARSLLTCAALWAVAAIAFLKPVHAQEAAPPKANRAPLEAPPLGAEAAPAAEESPRLQKLRQLQLDRRPSAILKAWAPQPPAEPKSDGTPPPKKEPLDIELETFQRHVTLGRWADVKTYLAGLPKDEAKAGYAQVLQSLNRISLPGLPGLPADLPPEMMQRSPAAMRFAERHQLAMDDIVGLAAAAPHELTKETIDSLGSLLRQTIATGTVVEAAAARLKSEIAKSAQPALTARQAARMLCSAGETVAAGEFLPTLEKARAAKDLESLNLLARHFLGLHAKDSKLTDLERAWTATQDTLANAGPRAEHEEALKRAVDLAPKLKAELGSRWLEESFSAQPERGMDILATIGTVASQGLQTQPQNSDIRLKSLQLQKTAVQALLKSLGDAAPQGARQWAGTITLLAGNWLREADVTHQFYRGSGASRIRRDPWGNIFFVSDEGDMMSPYMQQRPDQPKPISPVDVLEARPEQLWLAQVNADLRPKLEMMLCQMYLKAEEEAKAFPYIEQLATSHPEKARELVNEFLRVWTRNHDPNANRNQTNYYMFMYGFDQRANGIPLTRSKQERNLEDLAGWVARLRKLPLGDPDEELLARAFTTCHSTAEVYRGEAIEKVFGPIGGLRPKTLSGLVQQMRENLATVWRQPAQQEQAKTKRKTKDIQAEVLRGYRVASTVVDDALKKFPDDWSLVLARAAVWHDENSFRQEVAKSSDFAPKRDKAHAEFQRAAALYAAKVQDLPEEEQTTKVYEQWFYASLGAVDLGQLNEEKQPDLRQPALIRAAIEGLPGEAAERHMARFANVLFTRMSSVKPASKFLYLKGGMAIVGDHKQAAEARKVFDYYGDLVREIQLVAEIDGSDKVGHKTPFGVFVKLRHTGEIERESGGFGRYLQNQNSNMYFAWNYGRPIADYRDRFQNAAAEALKEHFEVLSVTFETDKVHSRATSQYGWRVTPYAYLLLKARGPQVDRLPPLRLDLDFLDTSGYAVLPVESPAVRLDARSERGEARPAEKLEVAQTLDERQADKGKLILEIKASSLGLTPDLSDLLELAPKEFDIVKTDDQGVSVAKFDADSEEIAVAAERTWLVTLEAKPGLAERPKEFQFASARLDDVEMVYQRYNDADLTAVEPVVSLEQQYGKTSYAWAGWVAALVGLLTAAAVVLVIRRRSRAPQASQRLTIPEPLTPFTAIGFLERLWHDERIDMAVRDEIERSIALIHERYFSAEGNGHANGDLKEIAENWARRLQG